MKSQYQSRNFPGTQSKSRVSALDARETLQGAFELNRKTRSRRSQRRDGKTTSKPATTVLHDSPVAVALSVKRPSWAGSLSKHVGDMPPSLRVRQRSIATMASVPCGSKKYRPSKIQPCVSVKVQLKTNCYGHSPGHRMATTEFRAVSKANLSSGFDKKISDTIMLKSVQIGCGPAQA